MAASSKHVANLLETKPYFKNELGSMQRVNADNLEILKNLSIKRLILEPGSIREPHWHANTNELTYLLSGKVLVSILDNNSEFASFALTPGQMFHVETGSLHHIENIGDETAELIICFRHERPVDFSLWASFGEMSDAVLGNTFDEGSNTWANIKRDTQPKFLVKREGKPDIPTTSGYNNPHKFNIEGQSAPVLSSVGSAKKATSLFWPVLKNIAMYSLRVAEDGMREPHWHPITGELGYVHRGAARMSVMDPDGSVDTYTLKQGDVYFVPAAYPHHIEVIGDEEMHFLIFFDQPMPQDIGYRASASAFSGEVMAAMLGTKRKEVPAFPFTPADPLLVGKRNPVDPVK